jgi:hypothetical protein
MRKHWAFALLLLTAANLRAQLPSGSIAPDFTATDLNGQAWHLYDLLEQGKVVVLEISATWCSPCWAYHNGHAMHNLYNQHGPDGDDKATVFFVEGDPATNVNCLYGSSGCNNYTPGSWVSGTPFPIINNHSIADSFQVKYFPTIFVICPNRKAYEVGQWSAADLWAQAQTCPVASGNSNTGIFDFSAGTPLREVCDDLEIQPAFNLINLGTQALSQATIALHWNNTPVQTIEWSGNLGLYGEVPIAFDKHWVNSGGTLETKITSVNYAPTDDDPANNTRTENFTLAEGFNDHKVLLKIRTDQYGAARRARQRAGLWRKPGRRSQWRWKIHRYHEWPRRVRQQPPAPGYTDPAWLRLLLHPFCGCLRRRNVLYVRQRILPPLQPRRPAHTPAVRWCISGVRRPGFQRGKHHRNVRTRFRTYGRIAIPESRW